MQRTAPCAAANLEIGFARRRAGLVGHHPDIAVQLWVEARDAIEVALGQLDGRHLAVAQQRRELDYLEIAQIRHTTGPGIERRGGSVRFKSEAGKAATLRARFA